MKILMLSEYFLPYDFGGSEWSTYYLAAGLAKLKYDVLVLTPNYADLKKEEVIDGFKVKRFPFYLKNKTKKQLSPFWQTNFLWFIWTTFFVFKYCLINKVDLTHVQGKYFLPSVLITKYLLKKKIFITLRDYLILCPLGICLLKGKKVCNFKEFVFEDIKEHLEIYHQDKNFLYKLLIILFSIRARFISIILGLLLKKADRIIAISSLVKTIYRRNGFKNIFVIPNPVVFSNRVTKVKKVGVVYAGRFTPAKGVEQLLEAIPKVLRDYSDEKFYFYGTGFLESKLIQKVKQLGVDTNVVFNKPITHRELLKKIEISQLVVVPSIWPEPFGRLPIEALSKNIPVVVSKRCGSAEFVDEKWGKIVNPNSEEIAKGIKLIFKNIETYRRNIALDKNKIKKRFSDDIYNLHIFLYKGIK